jgi:hypothetical protein
MGRNTRDEPIYDVDDPRGYSTGFDLSLAGARWHQRVHGGAVMVSHDGGKRWNRVEEEEDDWPRVRADAIGAANRCLRNT